MNAHSIPSRPLSPAERPQPRDPMLEGARASDPAETSHEKAFTSLVEAQTSETETGDAGRGERAQEAPLPDETAQEQAGDPLSATQDAPLPAHPSLRPDLAWLAANPIEAHRLDPALTQSGMQAMALPQAGQGATLALATASLTADADANRRADATADITAELALAHQKTTQATPHAQSFEPHDRMQANGVAPDAFQTLLAETETPPILDLINAPASASGAALPARMAETMQTLQQPNLPTPTMPVPIMALPAAIGIKALEGAQIFDIRLDPDDLGRVDIVLEIDQEGGIRAAIAAEKPEALQLIMREARALEQAFDQAGFRRDENALSFSLADREASSQHSHDPSDKRNGTRLMTEGESDLPSALENLLARANGRLDVRI